MTKRDLYKDGKFLRTLSDDEASYIIKDGESIRVPLNMMDSMQRLIAQNSLTPTAPRHSPGYVQLSDSADDRMEQYADRRQKIADQWKQTPPLAASEPAKLVQTQQPLTGDADAAWERRNTALERAYLGAA